MVRPPIITANDGLKKGPWTPEEDQKLIDYIQKYGKGNWQLVAKEQASTGVARAADSDGLINYLRPDIKRGNFSHEEERAIVDLHSALGNKWSVIATRLPGRTDNEIKNYWNTHLRKKLLRSGIDPKTHQPLTHYNDLNSLVNLMNPLQDLAKIGLLRDVLRILVNSNPWPILSSASGHQMLNQLDGISNPFDGAPISTLPNMENGGNYMPSNYQPVLDASENLLPRLVPATPEISSVNNVGCVNPLSMQIMNDYDVSDDSLWKDVFDDSFLGPSFV